MVSMATLPIADVPSAGEWGVGGGVDCSRRPEYNKHDGTLCVGVFNL